MQIKNYKISLSSETPYTFCGFWLNECMDECNKPVVASKVMRFLQLMAYAVKFKHELSAVQTASKEEGRKIIPCVILHECI